MLQSMLKSLLTAVLVAVAATGHADEATTMDLPHLGAMQLTFRSVDPQRVLVEETVILGELARQMSGSTRWPLHSVRDTGDVVAEVGGRTKLDSANHLLTIQYLAHSRYMSGGYTGTTLTIPISYSVERGEDVFKVSLSFPDQGTIDRHGMPFLTRKLWDMREILDDYSSIAARLPSAELHFNYQVRGELESPYKPEAVLGNLERRLSRPGRSAHATTQVSGSGSVSRDERFACTINGKLQEVQVSTFPYHDGTKLGYEAVLPYTLRADGSASGGDDAAAMISLLSKIIDE